VARARNIKPGFFCNDVLAQCEYGARLLFVGLWTVADREGRLEDRPARIKALLFPFDNCKIEKWLDQLSAHRFITRYEVGGSKFIAVNNFKKHQHPHVKEPESTIPAPGAHHAGPADCGYRIPDTGLPHTENGGTVKDRAACDELFDRFWQAFPAGRKSGKGAARKAWSAAIRKSDAETIIAAALEYSGSPTGQGKFVKGPTPWLNQECWADDRTAWQRDDDGKLPQTLPTIEEERLRLADGGDL
jgi:hypothetical protein